MWGIPILFEIKLRAYRYIAFCSGRHMIITFPKLSCLTALIHLFLFKGPRSFKKSFKKLRNCREFKGQSNDATHDPPLKWLDNTFKFNNSETVTFLPLSTWYDSSNYGLYMALYNMIKCFSNYRRKS